MADKDHREYEEGEGSLDPELLYTKEYCIGWLPSITWALPRPMWERLLTDVDSQAEVALARSTRGEVPLQAS